MCCQTTKANLHVDCMVWTLQVYDALNAMGSTAWSINATILENVEYAYKELQGGFVGLPLHGSMDVHPVPPPLSKLFRTEAEKGQLKAYVSLHACVALPPPFQTSAVSLHAFGCTCALRSRKMLLQVVRFDNFLHL